METKIVIRKGSTVPGSGLLVTGELAWDDAGKSLYAGQDGGAAIKVGPGTGGGGPVIPVVLDFTLFPPSDNRTFPVDSSTTHLRMKTVGSLTDCILIGVPVFTPGYVGQRITLINHADSLAPVAFRRHNDATYPGTGLALGTAAPGMNTNSIFEFMFNGVYWCQIASLSANRIDNTDLDASLLPRVEALETRVQTIEDIMGIP